MTEQLLVISQADLTALQDRLARIEQAISAVEMRPLKDWLTIREMAELIDKSEATVRRRLNEGAFETKEIGGKVMLRRP